MSHVCVRCIGQMSRLGEVSDMSNERSIEWKIPNFLSLPEETGEPFSSPDFDFQNESYYLTIYLNAKNEDDSYGYIRLNVTAYSDDPVVPIVKYTLGLKSLNKEYKIEKCGTDLNDHHGHGSPMFLKRSELLERTSELMPSNILTITCSLKNTEFKENERTETLLKNFQELMLNGKHSDTTIKVKGKEFRLHRGILAARNRYFDAMFDTEMKERATGDVCIDDCEPEIFDNFVHFLYTGKLDRLSSENVCGLYEVSDKYQEDQLKTECFNFMINKISVDSFCDFITLALKYDEMELIEKATKFFCSKVKEIIRNVKWQSFMKEYSIQANELYIKAIDKYVSDNDSNSDSDSDSELMKI